MVGGMVDVGGYKLYYKCIGQDSPTVILEAGDPADCPRAPYQDWIGNTTRLLHI